MSLPSLPSSQALLCRPPCRAGLQTAFVLYTLFSDDLFNQNVQQLVDRKGFNGVMDMAFRWGHAQTRCTARSFCPTVLRILHILTWLNTKPWSCRAERGLGGVVDMSGCMYTPHVK